MCACHGQRWLIGLAQCLTLVWLILAALSMPTAPAEDDPWFNCHVHGNRICGPLSPWHGFVNLSE